MLSLGYCYCGSHISLQNCCQKYINGDEKAPTALALMRARYSAYATHQADYLFRTTYSPQRKYYSKAAIYSWATANVWQKLEIITVTETTVEFKAYYIDKNNLSQIHHELSTFKKENDSWFYVDGKFQ